MESRRSQCAGLSRSAVWPLLAALALPACHKPGPAASPPTAGALPPIPVNVVKVTLGEVPEHVTVVASAEGARDVQVRARVGGILQKRSYVEGEPIKAGQVLFEIERAPYEIALDSAKAGLAQAEAASATAEARKAQALAAAAVAAAQMNKAESERTQAARELARLQGLLADKAVSQREADAAESAVKSATAMVESAAAAQSLAAAAMADAKAAIAAAEAQRQSAEAVLRAAELNLSYTKVTAPIDGIAGRAEKSEGALVSASDGLLTTIVQVDPIWVRFSLSEADLARIPAGADPRTAIRSLRLLLPSGLEYAEAGQINFGASMMDPQMGTLALRAAFPNSKQTVLPGQFLRVRADVGSWPGVCLLPQEAVLSGPAGGHIVFVVDDKNTVAVRPVVAGDWHGDQWLIKSGLGAGDRVIIDHHAPIGMRMKMAPGVPVAVAPRAVDGPTPAPSAAGGAK